MRSVTLVAVLLSMLGLLVIAPPVRAGVVGTATLNDVNGDGIPDLGPADAIDVTLDYVGGGGGAPFWAVTVNGGTDFREFFFSYDTALNATDVVPSDPASWQSFAGPTPAAGTFGQFGFRLSSGSTDLPSLLFNILVDGNFQANGTGHFFAAKIASSGRGGFVGADSISPVPLPAAVWAFISGIIGIGALVARRRRLVARNQL